MIPEIFNIIEASLYISSSTLYPLEGVSNYTDNGTVFVNDPYTQKIQNIEMAAACFEFLASVGWCLTWWFSFPSLPGRGMSFDDPDFPALITIVIGAIIYLVYYIQILSDRSTYSTNYLYVSADYIYAVNAVLYFLAAMRDVGFFYWTPTAGVWLFYDKFSIKKEKIKGKNLNL